MAQSRVAVGAVLGTVTDIATTISTAVNTVSGSLDMVNNYVRHQQISQRKRQEIDLLDLDERLIEEYAEREADRKHRIGELLQDETKAHYYNQAYTRLKAALEQKAA